MRLRTAMGVLAAVAASGLCGAAAEEPIASATTAAPVVVELYTSQGCSSCPPADAFLGELARREDIVALSMHVDYWDYIGWKDPYASPGITRRQRAYAHAMGVKMIYTPQMVIDGRAEAVGSHEAEVEALIDVARANPKVRIAFRRDASGYYVELPAGTNPGPAPAVVWLAVYDRERKTDIESGENAGTRPTDYNVVREWRKLGTWNGTAMKIPLGVSEATETEHDACAVILQAGEVGPILGAAAFKMD
jgi:hypothetical protein